MYDVRRLLADFCALRAIPRSIYREILKYDVITVRRVVYVQIYLSFIGNERFHFPPHVCRVRYRFHNCR